ncbi:3-phosphoglycerate dehydrogenase [Microlunatus endophyticus]|uniref:3-phosphoglycerate dehydrogenase n=1 Tax=Microlunatus endophyticus TaxID=1716077 RepID=A0A917W1V0_9ACTN|nr:NAD(P)-dependent oxidoreductase [Microlunatus endophyticus]GGL52383.1 3-phosphoglycerate dehydrogenase [Microlunatus endophyticus]
MRILVAHPWSDPNASWDIAVEHLPGWDVRVCRGDDILANLNGVDVLVPMPNAVTAEIIEAGSFGLIQQYGVGLERVDVEAATANGVWVARLPAGLTGNADSVAEMAVAQILMAIRRMDESRAAVATGWWQPISASLLGSTVAIVGLGAIGTAVAQRLAGFGCRMIAVRAHPEAGAPPSVDRVAGPDELYDVLGQADVVICSAMASAATRHLFDAAAFAACKPGAIFVNVARGVMVDDPALLAALDSGRISLAGLDVFQQEPVGPDHPFARHPRVIATPHIGGLTHSMLAKSSELFGANVARWSRGQEPLWAVNSPQHPRQIPPR